MENFKSYILAVQDGKNALATYNAQLARYNAKATAKPATEEAISAILDKTIITQAPKLFIEGMRFKVVNIWISSVKLENRPAKEQLMLNIARLDEQGANIGEPIPIAAGRLISRPLVSDKWSWDGAGDFNAHIDTWFDKSDLKFTAETPATERLEMLLGKSFMVEKSDKITYWSVNKPDTKLDYTALVLKAI